MKLQDKIKITQGIGFISLFIGALIGNLGLILISVPFIIYSIYLRKFIPKKNYKDLDKKMKSELGIIAKTHMKKMKVFGGFVIPALPFFSVINKNRVSKEAIIHENIHLYYLQNGAFFVFIALSIFFSLILKVFGADGFFRDILFDGFILSLLILFEYIAFRRTNHYGDRFKIKTRKWNFWIFLNYFVLYSLWIMIMSFVFWVLKI